VELKNWMAAAQPVTLIDVREDDEWRAGHASAALHISRWKLEASIGSAVPDKNARIALYLPGRKAIGGFGRNAAKTRLRERVLSGRWSAGVRAGGITCAAPGVLVAGGSL
jgi:hypothetical protein